MLSGKRSKFSLKISQKFSKHTLVEMFDQTHLSFYYFTPKENLRFFISASKYRRKSKYD